MVERDWEVFKVGWRGGEEGGEVEEEDKWLRGGEADLCLCRCACAFACFLEDELDELFGCDDVDEVLGVL